eukprot:6463258-Amphidinium_carterae.1
MEEQPVAKLPCGDVKLTLAAVNATSMVNKLDEILAVQGDVLIISESRCTQHHAERLGRAIRAKGMGVVWGAPVPVLPTDAKHRPAFAGVAIIAKPPFHIATLELPAELHRWRDCGRLTAARIGTHGMSGHINVLGLYGHVSDEEQRTAMMEDVTAFLRSCKQGDWLAGGDLNTPTEESAAWLDMLACGVAHEPLDLFDERPEHLRPTSYVGKGRPIDHIYCSNQMVARCVHAAISCDDAFPVHHVISACFRFAALPERTVRDLPQPLPSIKLAKDEDGTDWKYLEQEFKELLNLAQDGDGLTLAYSSWCSRWEAWYVDRLTKDNIGGCTTRRLCGQQRAACSGDSLPPELLKVRKLLGVLVHVDYCNRNSKHVDWHCWEHLQALWKECGSLSCLPERDIFDAGSIPTHLADVRSLLNSKLAVQRREWYNEWKSQLAKAFDPHGVKAYRYIRQADAPPFAFVKVDQDRVTCNATEQDEVLHAYWEPIFMPEHLPHSDELATHADAVMGGGPYQQWSPGPIMAEDVKAALRKGKSRTSAGKDGWQLAELRSLPLCGLAELASFFMACEKLKSVPMQWSEAWITMIPKGRVVPEAGVHEIDNNSAPCTPDRLRPISILSIPWRVMMRCRASQVAEWQEPLLHDWQHGARRKHGTEQCIAQTYHLLESALCGAAGSSPLHGLTIDISKCFDSIPLEAVQQAWICAGLEPAFAHSWCSMWALMQRRFRLPNSILGSPFTAKRGLPQGDPMSTIACNIVFAGLCRLLQAEAIRSGIEIHVSNYLDDMIVLVSQPFHLQIVRKVLADFFDKFAIRLNDHKSYVFSTCPEVADNWRAHGSPINFAVADTLHLLGTELSLRRSLPYAGSTTEEKVGKICKRLRRVMLLPVARSIKAGMIGNGCLSILGYCPVRPLPDQKTINLLRSWVVRAQKGKLKRGADSFEARMSLFLPAHRCDPRAAMVISAMRLVKTVIEWNPVSAWQIWLLHCRRHKVRVVGPITALLAHLHALGVDTYPNGTIGIGSLVVPLMAADFGDQGWMHQVRHLLRVVLLRQLVSRRRRFQGAHLGIQRALTLKLHSTLKDPLDAGVLELWLCGGLPLIGHRGDLREPGNDLCPYCDAGTFSFHHIIHECDTFSAVRKVTWQQLQDTEPCFQHYGLVPDLQGREKELYPEALVDAFHRQLLQVWRAKCARDDILWHDTSRARRVQRFARSEQAQEAALAEKNNWWLDGWSANGHEITNIGTVEKPSFQCSNCGKLRCWKRKASFSQVKCEARKRVCKTHVAGVVHDDRLSVGQHLLEKRSDGQVECVHCHKHRSWANHGRFAAFDCRTRLYTVAAMPNPLDRGAIVLNDATLPQHVLKMRDGSIELLWCSVCSRRDRHSNRKRFLKKHGECAD